MSNVVSTLCSHKNCEGAYISVKCEKEECDTTISMVKREGKETISTTKNLQQWLPKLIEDVRRVFQTLI